MSGLWIVTGASRGIGAAIARSLASPERPLLVTATGLAQLEALAHELRRRNCIASTLALDLAAPETVAHLSGVLNDREVAGVVNNAGVLGRGAIEALTDAEIDRVLAVNVAGAMRVTRAALPHMKAGGRIINVGSVSGTLGTPEASLYNATKWAMTGLTRSWAEELRPRGIFVAEVRPGAVDTDLLRGTPFPAQMQPNEVARAVRFLALEAPAAATGTSLDLFG